MKRIYLVLLCLLLISFYVPVTAGSAAVLDDIAGTKYREAVEYLNSRQIMRGYPDNTFRPEDPVTRAEFAVIATMAVGLRDKVMMQQGRTDKSYYNDVPSDHWAYPYINVAAEQGLISGYGDGEFGVNDNLSYSAAATILVRMLGVGAEVDKSGMWPDNYISYASGIGITEDVEINDWNDLSTRGNIAIMVYNTQKITGNYSSLNPGREKLRFFQTNEDGENGGTDYTGRFAQGKNDFIGVEFSVSHEVLPEGLYYPVTYKLCAVAGGCFWEKTLLYHVEPGTEESVYREQLPWDCFQEIYDGKFRVEIHTNREKIAEKEFEVYTDRSYEISFVKDNIKVKSLKFFGLPYNFYTNPDDIADVEIVYKDEFKKGYDNSCICWELELEFPAPDRSIDFPIEFKYFTRGGDRLWGHHTIEGHRIYFFQTNAVFTGGIFTNEYKKWISDKYKVEIYVYGEKIAEGTFKVVP